MSASLVGSEMCIRDRPKHAAACSARHLRWRPALGQHMRNTSEYIGSATVSYTHLTLPTICSV
eukprot:9290199-Alexandrium_andersonii.AAC.1